MKLGRELVVATLVAFIVFCGGIVYGLYNPSGNILEKNSDLRRIVMLGDEWQMVAIYMNNLAIMLLLYVASMGLIPGLAILFQNGYIVGSVASIGAKRIGAAQVTLLLLPHGIFEIYAFMYAAGLGLSFPYRALKNRALIHRVLQEQLRSLLYAAIILFFAAFIEAFITAKIASLVTS